MADGGLRLFISYLVNLVRAENGTAINAIYAQIFKTLPPSIRRTLHILLAVIRLSAEYVVRFCIFVKTAM